MVDDNPWEKMGLVGVEARSALWTEDQVAAVVDAADSRGRPSIGLATLIAYWLGHRQADVLRLTWTALDAERVDTRKTKATLPVDVAAYPALAAMLDLARTGAQRAADTAEPKRVPPAHVVINEHTGRPRPPLSNTYGVRSPPKPGLASTFSSETCVPRP